MQVPRQRVVLLAYPRTGTNFLATSLGSLPDVTFHPEPFNPNCIFLASGVRRDCEVRNRDPFAFLELLERDCTRPIFGMKMLPSHAPQLRDRLIADPDWRCVVLFRHNFLAVYASQLMATQTGIWLQREGRPAPERALLPFQPAAFLRAYAAFRSYYRDLMEAFDRAGKPFLVANYTDLLDPLMLRNLARHIGASGDLAMRSTLIKQGTWDVAAGFADRAALSDTLRRIGRLHWETEELTGLGSDEGLAAADERHT